MKKYIFSAGWLVVVAIILASCNKFLEEDPKTFLSPKNYFKSDAQITAAVNGVYTFVDDIFDGDIEKGSQTLMFMDYLPGYAIRPYAGTTTAISQAMNLTVAENNGYLERIWKTAYAAIENVNSAREGIEPIIQAMEDPNAPETIISRSKGRKMLGEVYFFRAYFYFDLVRLFGEVPLKITSTKDLSNAVMPLSSQEDIYTRIVEDLVSAETWMEKAGAPWNSVDGRITKGAVKALLAKVYLTMAGYPVQKGADYYNKAYEKAHELYASHEFRLFANYSDLRNPANENSGEFIWMIQREADNAGSPVHNCMLPYPVPAKAISTNHASGGAMAPHSSFYNSYTAGDQRTVEQGFYYTEHEALDGSGIVTLDKPYIYKYWDDASASSGKSGANYSLLRYADVLLMMAEAKAQAGGGSTADTDAVDAYFLVRKRANPTESKPGSITVDDVLKERFWELCFEYQTWYDMIRTRKGFNLTTGKIDNLIGLYTPGHSEGAVFEASDLLFPYPLREVRLNPNLVRQ